MLLVLCLFVSPRLTAQVQDTTIALPNSSFEQWSTGNGYSVTVLFFPLSVYDSYTYPTGWSYPSFPVNETFSYSGMNFNVNTDIPLLKVSDETSDVQDSTHALKLQSFMLSDVLSPVIYGIAESSLDPALTSTIFPTILSTGTVNLTQFLPLLFNLANYFEDLPQLMSILDTLNLNTIIDGGIALDSLVPSRLTGYYKYTSAIGGDYGGVLLLGTKYNPITHQRKVVGSGYNISLTDTIDYTPFEVTYFPLSSIEPSIPYEAADSILILLFSSANIDLQQGSALYLDNLQLWGFEPTDSCSAVLDLHLINVSSTDATLGWGFEGDPNHFEAEYGVQGFTQGNGTLVGLTESFLHLSDLQPNTTYDVYVRCVCDYGIFGEWDMITFHTDLSDSTGIQTLTSDNLQIYPNPAHGKCVVRFAQEIPEVVRLYSVEGVLLKEIVPTKETLDLLLPSKGVFILSCETKERTVTRKIVNR